MKLRNKKTGEVEICEAIMLQTDIRADDYLSLAELNDEWEDYKPAEPLIKDEKIRKAVRAWADANEIVKAFVVMNEHMNWTVYGDDIDRNRFSIEFFDRVVFEKDETKNYTIAELCGEERE